MSEFEPRIEPKKGFRLHHIQFENSAARSWRTRFEDDDGKNFVKALEERGLMVQLAWASGQRSDGSDYAIFQLEFWNPTRPLRDEEREFVGKFLTPQKFYYYNGFPETRIKLGENWEVLYHSKQDDRQAETVSQSLRRDIEEVLAPHIDKEASADEIDVALSAATLNQAFSDSGDQITSEQVTQRIEFTGHLRKMQASGFFRVIDCDTWDLENAMICGEFEEAEEALERAREDAQREKDFQIGILQKAMERYPQGRSHFQEKIEGIKSGVPATSSIYYVYDREGYMIGKIPV